MKEHRKTGRLRVPHDNLAISTRMVFQNEAQLRGARLEQEFDKVDAVLRDKIIVSTIVVFGSSRILSPEAADALSNGETTETRNSERARRRTELSKWYDLARSFGRTVSERGGAIGPEGIPRRNVIATGGGPGIMEAANRGAAEAGAPSIGFNIILPKDQPSNPYTTPELTFLFHYFAMRKMHLALRANALAVFPGGFGTLDELFEILTLKQTHKGVQIPILLFDRAYWQRVINFQALVDFDMINPDEIELFDLVDTVEEAWNVLLKRGLTGFSNDRSA